MFLKTTEKVIQENAFDLKKKKPRVKRPSNNWALGSVSRKSRKLFGPEISFQIEIRRIRALVLANKLLLFVS